MMTQLTTTADALIRRSSLPAHAGSALLLAAVLGGAAWWAVRRSGRSSLAAASGTLAVLALLTALEVTLLRAGHQPGELSRLRTCRLTDPTLLSSEGLLNVGLLAPAAFLGVLAIGRPVLVATGLVVVSIGIEATQAILAVGVCDSSDVVHNAVGAMGAAALAAGVRVAVRHVPHPA